MYPIPGMSSGNILEFSKASIFQHIRPRRNSSTRCVYRESIIHCAIKQYLRRVYPFYQQPDYQQRFPNVINQVLETIFQPSQYETFRRAQTEAIVVILSQSVPFKPNFTRFRQNGITNQVATTFFTWKKPDKSPLRDRIETLGLLER
jgi:hypothetical protein